MENLSSKQAVKTKNNWRTDSRRRWTNPYRVSGGIGSAGAIMQEVRAADDLWRQINARQETPLLLEKQVRGALSGTKV